MIRNALAGAQTVITAPTIEELQELVVAWYEDAAERGLEDARIPWDPSAVHQGDEGYEFLVWAHS